MREFVISVGGQSISCLTAIWVNPAAAVNPNLEFMRFWIGQAANATSAQQRVQLKTQSSSFPTVVSATPAKLKPADPNASVITGNTSGLAGMCGVTATLDPTGTNTVYWEDAFNVLNGWLHVPTPAETKVMPASSTSGLGLVMNPIPATTTSWSYGLVYREV